MFRFLHVVAYDKVVRDPDGQTFNSLSDAMVAAEERARAVMIDALRARRTLPLDWRVEIADEAGRVDAKVSFASVGLGFELSSPLRTTAPE